MKKVIFTFAFMILLLSGNLPALASSDESGQESGTTINVICSNELYPLAAIWVKEFTGDNPGIDVRINASQDDRNGAFGSSVEGIGFFTGEELKAQSFADTWKIAVARNVTVPVINAANPYLAELGAKGITDESIAGLISMNKQAKWGDILGNGNVNPVHLYVSDEEGIISALKRYTGLEDITSGGSTIAKPDEVIRSVRNDPNAIGFLNLADITGVSGKEFTAGITILPIDKNKNGKIDYMEAIYDGADNFARGVWIGKYPKALYSDIYCVSDQNPEAIAEVAFIRWVLTSGQDLLPEAGLSELVTGERQSKLAELVPINVVSPGSEPVSLPLALRISLLVILIVAIVAGTVLYLRRKRMASAISVREAGPVYFDRHTVDLPKGLYYDKSHMWAFMEKDGSVKIGIDDFLQHVTGPVTRLELRRPGEKVRKGDMILSLIQNGKRLVVFAPVSGVIKESNSLLDSKYTLINSAPYTDGWVYRIEPVNWLREIQLMEMAEKYQTWLSSEFNRLKDFLASSLKVNKLEYDAIVLQDGGMLKDGVLEDFGPEVWEDFQSNFLDTTF